MHRLWLGWAALLIALVGAPWSVAAETYDTFEGVVYARHGDEELGADVFVPKEDGVYPGVVVVHGGAWTVGTRRQLRGIARGLAEHGYTAVAISYRLAPKHKFPAQLEDVRSAVQWMRQEADRYKIDPQRIGGYGYSAGAHLVALLAAYETSRTDAAKDGDGEQPSTILQAVVAGGLPCDFRIVPEDSRGLAYWLGGSRKEKPEAYEAASPLKFVTRNCPPMFLYHGERDGLVPLFSSRMMLLALRAAGVEATLHRVPGASHITAVFDEGAYNAAVKFLNRALKGADEDGADEDGADQDDQNAANARASQPATP